MRDNSDIYLSVVIPAYNEELRLPSTLDSIFKYLETKDYSYEVIIIDDGSKDGTSQLVKEHCCFGEKLKLITLLKNSGKGAAVKTGINNASGTFVIFNDADGASPIEEIEKLQQAILSGADIAIGSRALKDSQVKDLWYRRFLGVAFNTLIKVFVIDDFQDTQCGFKLFKTECAKNIFERIILSGFSFDVEVLFLAKKLSYKVLEVPINWHSVPGSKINIVVDAFKMFLAILKIRIMYIMGKYQI